MKFLQVYAVVDSSYRLLWVGGEWDEFALQNAAQNAVANAVLSSSIMDHIVGDETREITARIIDLVMETKKPLRMEYRCDSPSMARKFLLTVQPMKENRVLMVHDLRDAWHFSPPLQPWHFDSAASDCKCSFCGAVKLDGTEDWVSCDDIGEKHPARVLYEVCQSCATYVQETIAEVMVKASDQVTRD